MEEESAQLEHARAGQSAGTWAGRWASSDGGRKCTSRPRAAALHAGSEALEPGRSPGVRGARRGCRGAAARRAGLGAAAPAAPGAAGDKRQQEPGSESNKRCSTSYPDCNLHAKQTLSAVGFWYQAINKTFTQLEILCFVFLSFKASAVSS